MDAPFRYTLRHEIVQPSLKAQERRVRRRARRGGWGAAAFLALIAGLAGFSLWIGGLAGPALPWASYHLRGALADAGFTVERIEVRGARRVDAARVAAALELEPGWLIFDFDPAAARGRIEAMPWVKEASVLRLLPDRVVVLVAERQPVALWKGPEGLVVIDDEGLPIEGTDPAEHAGLARVEGEDAPRAAAELVAALARHPDIAERARAFERVGGRRWDIRIEGGMRVQLPEEAAEKALAELSQLDAREGVLDLPLESLDLRGEDLVMRPRDPAGFERGA